MATLYKIKTDAGVMYASADLVQAASSISVYFGTDPLYDQRGEREDDDGLRWQSTPFQTADARHDEDQMARLVAEYYDMGDVISVEAVND